MKRTLLIFFLILVFSFPAIKSLLAPGGYTSHDLTHHVVRQIDMDKLLSEGQFPPRWSGDLNNGYGYPLFIFAYPTPALLGEVCHKIGFNFIESVKAVMLFSMLISVIGMYLFLEALFPKQKMAAFLGAIFYLYAPVRFLNVYVSAAVGNALAMGILPFIFWTIAKTAQGKKWAVPIGSILIALLATSHNVTTLIYAPVFLAFALIQIFRSKEKLVLFKNLSIMAALGIGLSAFFFVPALYEKGFTIYNQVAGANWMHQFPTISQLIHSPWGYGLSHPETPEPGDISYQLGLAHFAVVGIFLASILIFRKRKELINQGLFWLGVFAASVFLILKMSYPLWANLPLLYLVQFPNRFASVAVFAASVIAAVLVINLPSKKVFFVIFLALVLYANRNHLNVNQKFDPGDAYYMSLKTTTTSFNEYMPIWAHPPQGTSPGKLEIIEGKGNVTVTENKSVLIAAEVNLSSDSKLRFNQFYFPGWELKVDGKPIEYSYQNEGESRGLPVFTLMKGAHTFEADFTDTGDRKIANAISVISFIGLGVLLATSWQNKSRR